MFSVEDASGLPVVEDRDKAIPVEVINELDNLRQHQQMSLEDAITYLRAMTLIPSEKMHQKVFWTS